MFKDEQRLRRNKMVATYKELLSYWSQPRFIGESVRLNQNQAFIDEQKLRCKRILAILEVKYPFSPDEI